MDYDLQGRLGALSEDYQGRLTQIRQLQEQASQVTASARSRDGLISVEVGAHGELLALHLDPGAYERLSPQRLASVIVELARGAAADAAARVREVMAPVLPTDGDLARAASPTLSLLRDMTRGQR